MTISHSKTRAYELRKESSGLTVVVASREKRAASPEPLHNLKKPANYETTRKEECPFKKTERKIHKKRKIKNQTELNLQIQ